LESGYIEEFIEDQPYSPFPQILNTERPDVAAAGLLDGRGVIQIDGTPFVIIAPATLYSLLQSAEDYYQRFLMGTLIRLLRYLFLLIALLLPSIYVAILTFHQEMIPATLLLSIAKSREEVPFPALVEALMMEVTFEALREVPRTEAEPDQRNG
jgi:spore germination protein KA